MSSAWLGPVALCHVGLPLSEYGVLIHTPKTTNNDFMGPFPRDYTRVEPCVSACTAAVPKVGFYSQIMERGMGRQHQEAPASSHS